MARKRRERRKKTKTMTVTYSLWILVRRAVRGFALICFFFVGFALAISRLLAAYADCFIFSVRRRYG